MTLVALPPADAARARPASPPSPPTTTRSRSFAAEPVSPEKDTPEALAPEIAVLEAVPTPTDAPVSPVRPVSPVSASPPTARAIPRIEPLAAVGVEVALPESPESPESPDTATGLASALDDASPVSPVLVAETWALEEPEAPEVAVGLLVVRLAAPPAPPSADAVATWAR